MAEDTGGIARLNYFNSQLLDATDFKVEQDYHLGMRRRHNMFVHTAGVAGGGLQVSKDGDKRVKVSAGMAIDSLGREIVFAADRPIDIDAVRAKANATVFLTISYADEKELPVRDVGGGDANHRRMGEHTTINFLDRKPLGDGAVLTLAAIKLDGGGNIAEIDNSVRALVGSVIDPRSDLTLRRLTVTGEQKIGTNLEIGANLSVAGNTDLRGSVSARSLAVTSAVDVTGGLTVSGASELRASLKVGVDVTVAQKLKVDGDSSLASLTVAGATAVKGNLTFGAADLLAVGAAADALRIVRGTVFSDGERVKDGRSSGGILVFHTGYQSSRASVGVYDITFSPPFSGLGIPAVALTPILTSPQFSFPTAAGFGSGTGVPPFAALLVGLDTVKMRVRICRPNTNENVDCPFSFIAIGPR